MESNVKRRMYLKDNDRNIMKHIEKYGFITTKQTELIFYRNHRCSYKEACRRLKILRDNNLIIKTICSNALEYVYVLDSKKNPSRHSILLMDFYAKLINLGCEIINFYKEYNWFTKKRSDGFIEFKFGKIECCPYIIEVDFSHKTNIDNKYIPILDSHILQDKYKKEYGIEMFPKICIISMDDNQQYNGFFNVVFLNDKLDNFVEKILDV